ncbi:hypothetical protein ACWIEX_11335 [Bosea sp. NPDC055353]
MKRDLPTPGQILEELADKTAAQIDRMAPVAFDDAWREMTRYHRFLLALNASRTPDGAPFSYAEVAGYALRPPHRDWLSQYGRLFERAAARIPDDGHFIRALAYAPYRLVPKSGDPELPPKIISSILDLGPSMMHRIEAWVTRRTTVETPVGLPAEPRLALAGSDAKAYVNVLPDVIGAWESLLQQASSIYRWREGRTSSDSERWAALRASWPYLWQHLSNTAYCLALAVWNEDEAGSAQFREALVRWPKTLHQLAGRAELRSRHYLLPDVVVLSWPEASARVAPLTFERMPAPTPEQLFTSVVRSAHDDVLLLTAGLLLFWTISDKQASDIGARTALALLKRMGGDDDRIGPLARDLSLRSLFLDLLVRFEIAGERFSDGSYGAELDRLVEVLDNMTERRVVPGRVFTPSTLHGRDGLLLSFGAILAAAAPDTGDDGLQAAITALAADEVFLPGGDRSLRNILYELRRLPSVLEQPSPQLLRGVAMLTPDRDVARLVGRLGELVRSAEATIEAARLQRLRERPVDPGALERIRLAVEAALLAEPAQASFFKDVRIERSPRDESAEWRETAVAGIAKAQLVDPPMETPAHGFEELLASRTRESAGSWAWGAFTRRARIQRNVGAKVEQEEFWREIAPLVEQVGPAPVLVISQNAETRALRRLVYEVAEHRPQLQIERRPSAERLGSYVATVAGIDVYGANFPAGVAWLFSGRALRSIRYSELDASGDLVAIGFEPDVDLHGTLRLRFRQHLEWSADLIFELRAPDPDEEEDPAA